MIEGKRRLDLAGHRQGGEAVKPELEILVRPQREEASPARERNARHQEEARQHRDPPGRSRRARVGLPAGLGIVRLLTQHPGEE